MKTLYATSATATGGRTGTARSDDGALTVTLAMPREMGGQGDAGTNPEQLFAAGYAACFLSALKFVAGQQKVAIADEATVTAKVGIGPIDPGKGEGFALTVSLEAAIPGIEREAAEALLAAAHRTCPYSNATRGNVDVQVTLAA
ncbi:organic hydroperoxide resistance protein [Sphingomonas gei]|uniref:Organic hydroperoxide resistance protein n=1 Tax=Sphingomonas gei TaxID=1395960 RepID=A0A4S1XJ50_9SPHN|nr:organic hydroperoxide resistance protein [Sphingomonas gei]TGX55166.1 organic hydroperoxide resistance protein [Sphingomonas gei]